MIIAYAVDQNKRHRIINQYSLVSSDERIVKADAEGWIPWNGGDCPLPKGHLADIEYNDGAIEMKLPVLVHCLGGESGRARTAMNWSHDDCLCDTDIVAYRPILDDKDRTVAMVRGKTEVETLHLNGWGVGDILEGDEGNGPDRIKITHIGEERFGCRWDHKCNGDYGRETFNTTLICREWKKVGDDKDQDMDDDWHGPQDGLPPIGIEVEFRRCDSDWRKATVVGNDGCRVIVRMNTDSIVYDWAVGGGIRSIRTSAQRDEDEAVEAMVAIMECAVESDGITVANSCQLKEGATCLYRAGYRPVGRSEP